ncbi:MAG: preprotein translocase subunit YajC [Oligoflexia bacterium]|nr:preprotein translocase subunit YajC [Oligoflexia bacterium]
MFSSVALAQAAGAGAAQPSIFEMLFPFAAMMFIFYFLYARPQARRQKEQQKLLEALKRGDQVVTTAGIFGTITGVTDKYITLEIAENVRIKVLRTHIAGTIKEGNP